MPRIGRFALFVLLVLLAVGLLVGVVSPAQARVLGPDRRPSAQAAAGGAERLARQGAARVGVPLPVRYDGAGRQVIAVQADCGSCTSATLQAWDNLGGGRFMAVTGPLRAKIGARGVGPAYEGSNLTPLGTWDLTEAFGRVPNPGTAMPYFVAGPSDYWDGRPGSPTYNTHVRSAWPIVGENLRDAGWVYDYAVVMGVNQARVPYGGSGFFLHVTDGRPTAGCVAIEREALAAILRWLDPTARPQMVVTL